MVNESFIESEKLAKKGNLSIKSFKKISEKVDSAASKHAKKLLDKS